MSKLAVLLAGTSNSHLEIARKLLRFHYEQCEVEFAFTGSDLIKKVTATNYDLVLFEYSLGDMDALEALGQLAVKQPRPPFVILIEEGDEAKAIKALEAGAEDYILKVRGYLTELPFSIRKYVTKQPVTEIVNKREESDAGDKHRSPQLAPGYFTLDRKGRILSANSALEQMTSYSRDELVELMIDDLLPNDRRKSFHTWLHGYIDTDKAIQEAFETKILDRRGNEVPLNLQITAVRDDKENILSYRGRLIKEAAEKSIEKAESGVNQLDLVRQLSEAITTSHDDPLSVFLEKLIQIGCQTFKFKRSTLALLDKRKSAFIKQAMVGYPIASVTQNGNVEVPGEVIDRIFDSRFRVKVIYYNIEHQKPSDYLNAGNVERRTQQRRGEEWHPRDLVLVNLVSKDDNTFGYISLDQPFEGNTPDRDIFHNLEIYGQLVSMALENYYQFSTIEKHSRRLKQILVTSNIFKLYLSLSELLQEVVWSVKFSLDFNLVALGLISKKTGMLEVKAVACDDKAKKEQIQYLNFPLDSFSNLFRSEYDLGKSYFISREEEIIRRMKQIYYGLKIDENSNGHWPQWGLLIVPIRSREGKIIGVLMADDPVSNKRPSDDVIRILEIMANQVAVAIDNRVLYVKAQAQASRESMPNGELKHDEMVDYTQPGFRRFVNKIFG